jgi:hypothetical protein
MNITIQQLESMLNEQKRVVGEYITRNLSTYSWYNDLTSGREVKQNIDSDLARTEMKKECNKSPYPEEFNTLKKYLTDND